jgi:hypothetical protein
MHQGALIREFVLEEVCTSVDALSRDATRELLIALGLRGVPVPPLFKVRDMPEPFFPHSPRHMPT